MRKLFLVFVLFGFLAPVGNAWGQDKTSIDKFICNEYIVNEISFSIRVYKRRDIPKNKVVHGLWVNTDKTRSKEMRLFIEKMVDYVYNQPGTDEWIDIHIRESCEKGGIFSPSPAIKKILLASH